MSINPLDNPGLSQATLKIPITGVNAIQDEDGNWATDDETIEDYQVFFKKPGRQPEVKHEQGIDGFSVYLKGYILKPKFLPETLRLPIKVECIRIVGEREQHCEFEIRPTIVSTPVVEKILGQAIEGWLFWKD